jgi:acyl-CoA reductase-like NAD-dependent aldehyde dehydrogenase
MKTKLKTIAVLAVAGTLGMWSSSALAERQPHMHRAMRLLEEARESLTRATHDKGGHRVKAIEHIDAAMAEVRSGISFDNRN